jgi:hypothetical protein
MTRRTASKERWTALERSHPAVATLGAPGARAGQESFFAAGLGPVGEPFSGAPAAITRVARRTAQRARREAGLSLARARSAREVERRNAMRAKAAHDGRAHGGHP